MKKCNYCNTVCDDRLSECPNCGASDFKYKCPNCGRVHGDAFCPSCGVKAGAAPKRCPNCGNEYYSNACPECGYTPGSRQAGPQTRTVFVNDPITERVVDSDGKLMCNKWVALILCFFLGIFGAHKFYEKKPVMGILYLCTGGLCGIGWLVDMLVLAGKPTMYYPKK